MQNTYPHVQEVQNNRLLIHGCKPKPHCTRPPINEPALVGLLFGCEEPSAGTVGDDMLWHVTWPIPTCFTHQCTCHVKSCTVLPINHPQSIFENDRFLPISHADGYVQTAPHSDAVALSQALRWQWSAIPFWTVTAKGLSKESKPVLAAGK